MIKNNGTTNGGQPLYWTLLVCGNWKVHLAAAEEGLSFVGSQDRPYEELAAWAATRFPERPLVRGDEQLRPYADELIRYFRGEPGELKAPLFYRGTAFQEAVWQALREIPYGQLRTYSDIAERIGKPAAVRAVGAAIGANPILIAVPCHRVIGKNGALTGYRGGMAMKTQLLELERLP
ncbi:methylated-DNA--[protein]-cysteine S-methyltransferase [Cohnella fermenti]|uniref:methylated-DNA--[protein]-cysteine S-methyltransferase n=1 Tax=Cohnella fermenti TaxID=2565925 RepID=A0A4S4BWB1_9BACL|nr:methylated-DNA--[protein]-cysteine S-methyltransferase [Cohnella fermenti]THF79463.1 methylated-DNA--[protein]-cysteine S-methyltransferase [Cohnella fermenti]